MTGLGLRDVGWRRSPRRKEAEWLKAADHAAADTLSTFHDDDSTKLAPAGPLSADEIMKRLHEGDVVRIGHLASTVELRQLRGRDTTAAKRAVASAISDILSRAPTRRRRKTATESTVVPTSPNQSTGARGQQQTKPSPAASLETVFPVTEKPVRVYTLTEGPAGVEVEDLAPGYIRSGAGQPIDPSNAKND